MRRSGNFKDRVVAATGLALAGALLVPSTAFASPQVDVESFNEAAEASIQRQLESIANDRSLEVEFGDVSVSAPEDVVASYDGNAELFADEVIAEYENDVPQEEPAAAGSGGQFSTMGTRNYTSSVFAGVPAGGVCHVKQDFRATVTNYKVTSKSLRGNSYQTGVCVFAWSPNYSYFSGKLNLHSKGTFSAIVKGSAVNFSATFKAIYKVNKSSLTQNKQ